MRLATKRALDFHLGRPLLTSLQAAARLLGLLLRRDHSLAPVGTVLIAKFQGLGSLVLCKPALARLREHYPEARILFWGTPATVTLARQMPEFDEILVLDDRTLLKAVASLPGVLLRLWRLRVDWAFDLEPYSRFSSALITMSMARNRTGFALEQLRSRRVHTHLIYFNRYHHLGDAYARIFGQLLPDPAVIDTGAYGAWRFPLDPLPSIPGPYFLVNIHAGDLSLERRWPRPYFEQLIAALLDLKPGSVAVLIGHGAAEVEYVAPLAQGERRIDLSGKLDLQETIRVIANAELVVTNDSAPLHLALATGSRVVGLFGPTRAESYLPPGRSHAIGIHVPLYCSPCVHHWEPPPCNGDNQCMKRITVTQVLARCCDLLGLPVPDSATLADAGAGEARSTYYPGLVYRRSARG